MITKKELKKYYHLVQEINDMREEIKELESLRLFIGSIGFDSTGKSSGNGDSIGNRFARIDDLRENYVLKIEERIMQQERIEKEIERLNVVEERRVIRYRYIDGLEWGEIAGKMYYSERHVHRIHGEALLKLGR